MSVISQIIHKFEQNSAILTIFYPKKYSEKKVKIVEESKVLGGKYKRA